MRELEKEGENVDMVFIGGSRTYRSFDTKIFDDELDLENTLNQGCPAQRTTFSYYLLKDTLERFHPKYVVIGSTYNGMIYEQDTRDMLYNLDRLNLKNKLECVLDHYGFNLGVQVLIERQHYINNLYPSKIKRNITEKNTFSKGEPIKDGAVVRPSGYRGEHDSIEPGSVTFEYGTTSGNFDKKEINDRQFEYYDKMVKLCKEKGIKVILVSGPCSLMNVYRTINYQGAVDYYTEYAKENGITYYNLNYIKDREKIFPDEMFIDKLHLNYEGGKRASEIFVKIIKDEIAGKDTSHYFYKDLDDLKKDVKRIPTCSCGVSCEAGKIIVRATSFHNDDVTPKYRLLVAKPTESGEEEKYSVIANWSTKDKWVFTLDGLKEYKHIKLEASTGAKDDIKAFAVKNLKEVIKDAEKFISINN